MVKLGLHGSQAGLDVSQALLVGQLREGHAQELILATEARDLSIAPISPHTGVERLRRQEVQQLRENESSNIHKAVPSRINWKDHGPTRHSN
jgi:hypothetical protein